MTLLLGVFQNMGDTLLDRAIIFNGGISLELQRGNLPSQAHRP
jgi:hypothetical protein